MGLETILTVPQMKTLAAAVQRILPSHDGPGAAEAHVFGYFDYLLAQGRFERLIPRLKSGLDLLQWLALEDTGSEFADCQPGEQDTVLEKIHSIPHEIPQRFLRMLVNMTLAGFLCDPVHGGNRDGIGWSYIGFQPRLVAVFPEHSKEKEPAR